jgi:hypothetical protein
MSQVDRILETIDHGVGRPISGVANPLNVSSFSRTGCGRRPDAGHDFCAPCLAWLRFESDDDPLERALPEESVEPEDDYYSFVMGMCGY